MKKEKNIGYNDALNKVLNIRANRQGNWEEDWRHYTTMTRGGITELKTGRIVTQAKKIIKGHPYEQEALIDSLADLINYSLFWLQTELEKQNKYNCMTCGKLKEYNICETCWKRPLDALKANQCICEDNKKEETK